MRSIVSLLVLSLAAVAGATPAGVHDPVPQRVAVVEMDLDADLGHVTLRQLEILRLLVRAARVMDALYEQQVSPGGFYPADMSREEFERWQDPAARSRYTRIRRDALGELEAVPYHEAWPRELGLAARLLAGAGDVTTDEALRMYLTLRARALITGDHARADAAWQAVRDSDIDILIGPIGVDADREFGLKAAFGAYVLLRDWALGAQLAQLKVFLPRVQHSLPVSEAFKGEVPDVEMKLAVYDLLYLAGDKRAELQQGPRGLQLRNVLRARFDALVEPVADELIDSGQRAAVRFDAFLLNSLLHEMSHGLGLRRTIDDRQTVDAALREHAGTIEDMKAAVLSLWLFDQLQAAGELPEARREEFHASFLAGTLQAIRLDPYGPVGQARQMLFNHFRDWGAFRRDAQGGRYRVDPEAMEQAIESLAAQVLTLQGSGDYAGAAALVETMGNVRPDLLADLERLGPLGVPAVFEFHPREDLPGL